MVKKNTNESEEVQQVFVNLYKKNYWNIKKKSILLSNYQRETSNWYGERYGNNKILER